jgi:8-oxo-dGTP diphosphatase
MACVNVGVSIFLFDENGRVLLGLRSSDPEKSELEGGNWCIPGGKSEENELVIDSIIREVYEETGITLEKEKVILIGIVEHIVKKHYLSFVFMYNEPVKQEPKVTEPDEMLEWKWFKLDEVPDNLYLPTKDAFEVLEKYKKTKQFVYIVKNYTN